MLRSNDFQEGRERGRERERQRERKNERDAYVYIYIYIHIYILFSGECKTLRAPCFSVKTLFSMSFYYKNLQSSWFA